jgi:voltage-gated potassium channel
MKSIKDIINEENSHSGQIFNFTIQAFILLSMVLFSLETLPEISKEHLRWLHYAEITITVVFTIEYALRIYAAEDKWKFITSFYGIVDLLAILPFYVAMGLDTKLLRTLRLFKLFRAFKMFRHLKAANRLYKALYIAREEFVLFFTMAVLMLFLSAAGIYHFEHEAQPEIFKSIFHCLWWSVATLFTVGYGDMYPITTGGRVFTFFILIVGLSIVAVPTGLLAAAMVEVREKEMEELKEWEDSI